jgi:hypothetical protein
VGEALGAGREGAGPDSPPKETKEIQRKKLGFPWIPLAESGLINGLRRIQVKKSFPVSHCASKATNHLPRPRASAPGSIRGLAKSIARIPITVNKLRNLSVSLQPPNFGIAALRHVIVMRLSDLLPHCTIDVCSAAI